MTRNEELDAAVDACNAARAALDRMVQIADESGMYDLPPQQPHNSTACTCLFCWDENRQLRAEIEQLQAEIKILHMALDSYKKENPQ